MVPERNSSLLRNFSGNPNTHLLFAAKIQPSRVETRVRVRVRVRG